MSTMKVNLFPVILRSKYTEHSLI